MEITLLRPTGLYRPVLTQLGRLTIDERPGLNHRAHHACKGVAEPLSKDFKLQTHDSLALKSLGCDAFVRAGDLNGRGDWKKWHSEARCLMRP